MFISAAKLCLLCLHTSTFFHGHIRLCLSYISCIFQQKGMKTQKCMPQQTHVPNAVTGSKYCIIYSLNVASECSIENPWCQILNLLHDSEHGFVEAYIFEFSFPFAEKCMKCSWDTGEYDHEKMLKYVDTTGTVLQPMWTYPILDISNKQHNRGCDDEGMCHACQRCVFGRAWWPAFRPRNVFCHSHAIMFVSEKFTSRHSPTEGNAV